MNEKPHTTDLGTRYRYRQEGAKTERKRTEQILGSLRKEYSDKLAMWSMMTGENVAHETNRFRFYIQALDDIVDQIGENK